MREAVTVMYVVGALVTALGVILAFRRARQDLRQLEQVAVLHETHVDVDVDLVEVVNATLSEDDGAAVQLATQEAQEGELRRALLNAGIEDGAPRIVDLGLPMEYWAKRSALRDAVASFRSGGLVALSGLALSTIASVWSLYLPAAG